MKIDKITMYRVCNPIKRPYTTAFGTQKAFNSILVRLESEGLSATVYTEVSDVEDELNGLLTFDRRVCKAEERSRSGGTTSISRRLAL